MFQTISMSQLEAILDAGGDFTLADVREREEYERGHLEGAVSLPLSELEKAPEILPRGKTVIVYCSHGGNSILAARELSGLGYHVVNTYGGLSYYRGCHFIQAGSRMM